jgi:hypothetical protein
VPLYAWDSVNLRTVTAVLAIIIGLLALAVGVIYFTVEGKSLPSILGQVHGYMGHRSKRGVAAVIVGAILLLVGGGLLIYKPRSAQG